MRKLTPVIEKFSILIGFGLHRCMPCSKFLEWYAYDLYM